MVQHSSAWEGDASIDGDDRQPAIWDQAPSTGQLGRLDRRRARFRAQAQAREERWRRNRFAVPYRTDGPKVTFGVLWFGLLLGAAFYRPVAVAAVMALVAALAAFQTAHAWYGSYRVMKWWAMAGAVALTVTGLAGARGLAVGFLVAAVVVVGAVIANPPYEWGMSQHLDAMARSTFPIGLAAGSVVALTGFEIGAILALILLISAYEVGDFLIGSGSSNAVEGPLTGMVSLGTVLFILWVAAPAPFTDRSMVLFGLLAAVCCPLGQILAAAILPRGSAWAPALRRLDSYLLVAPLWLFLLLSSPTASTL